MTGVSILMRKTLVRELYCPICGAVVTVRTDGKLPEVLEIPDHVNNHPGRNLCQGCKITVTIELPKCAKCGRDTIKTSSGVCIDCYGDATK